jgi:hypothetical protein
MRYLKRYENGFIEEDIDKLEIGDYVVTLYKIGLHDEDNNFPIGGVYEVLFDDGTNVPYKITNLQGNYAWASRGKLRKATDEEIKLYKNMNKYNI